MEYKSKKVVIDIRTKYEGYIDADAPAKYYREGIRRSILREFRKELSTQLKNNFRGL